MTPTRTPKRCSTSPAPGHASSSPRWMDRSPRCAHGAHVSNNTASGSPSRRRRRSTRRTTRRDSCCGRRARNSMPPDDRDRLAPGILAAALAEVGYPAVIKPTQSWVTNADCATRVVSKVVLNESEAVRYVEQLITLGGSPVITADGQRALTRRSASFTRKAKSGRHSPRWPTARLRSSAACRWFARAYQCRTTWNRPPWLSCETWISRAAARSNSGEMPPAAPS